MKVIDLLNKIAKDEKVPSSVEYNGTIYEYDETDDNEIARYRDDYDSWLFDDAHLNDEVEIKGFSEKIKKINAKGNYIEDEEVLTKINEIIDEVNKLIKEKNRYHGITITGKLNPINGSNVTYYKMSDQVDI